jgi:hypothetical protein
MWLVLLFFRVLSWSRHHPLLAEMYQLRGTTPDNEDAEYDRLMLGEAIVRCYLPPEQSDPLLARMETAKLRAARLLGLDDRERLARDQRTGLAVDG